MLCVFSSYAVANSKFNNGQPLRIEYLKQTIYPSFFTNRTLTLKEIANSTKHFNKNKNYVKILKMPFIFNLQTVSTAHRRCRSSQSHVVDVISVLEKKKDEPPMKLLDDPKILTVIRSP
jgi:hypothetical protein